MNIRRRIVSMVTLMMAQNLILALMLLFHDAWMFFYIIWWLLAGMFWYVAVQAWRNQ